MPSNDAFSFNVDMGIDAKAYLGENDGSGTVTECDALNNVTVEMSAAEADTSTRANGGWRTTAPGLRECTVTTEIKSTSAAKDLLELIDKAVTSLTSSGRFILGAFLNRDYRGTPIVTETDGTTTTNYDTSSKGRGPCGHWCVTQYSENQPLEDVISYSVTFKLSNYLGMGPGRMKRGEGELNYVSAEDAAANAA